MRGLDSAAGHRVDLMLQNCDEGVMRILVAILIGLSFTGSAMSQPKARGCGQYEELKPIITNFGNTYFSNYELFFGILDKFTTDAMFCNDKEKVACVLELSSYGQHNSEYGEYIAEIIERRLFLANPECFFDAALILDSKYYGDVSESINSPVFIEGAEIKSAIDKYSAIPKYKDIIVRLGIKSQ